MKKSKVMENKLKLTIKELHYLIDEHMQKDPRHALQDMDGWAVNYPGHHTPQHTYYLLCILGTPSATKKEWKKAYSSHRKMERELEDQDPGGCYGRYE